MADLPAVAVHPGNRDQLRAWDGDGGAYWAARAEYFERAVARYTAPFFAAAGIGHHDRVLDVGCGSGGTTREAARRAPAGAAVGVDLSSAMLEVARRAAEREGLGNVRFVQADAQVHPFPAGSFDVAVSRTGAMFFADPVAAFTNIGRALVGGGRLVLLVWQTPAANEWFREIAGSLAPGRPLPTPPPGVPSPFSLADPDRVRTILGTAGFGEIDVTGVAEPEWFGRDVDDAVSFIHGLAGWMLEGQDDDARARALADLRRSAERHLTEDGVEFGSAAWLVTARRAA
ncbi:methyltransferase domain-containing protein [Blastococcus sp. CT_GayMR20]|uniref:class I SAM-dependent methyltransferase n=1 Tax=Blastococcus sp. CT_GayMR20 TaxID=2559609 RepID=UPI001073ADBA|nr:class I SAM-dependent methyltransferase [Blastococcus sp. CT_GayMR20]TFV81434.1 methyltransferase domain-containing protein [Blastococcus sp. CT_GayMR20]